MSNILGAIVRAFVIHALRVTSPMLATLQAWKMGIQKKSDWIPDSCFVAKAYFAE